MSRIYTSVFAKGCALALVGLLAISGPGLAAGLTPKAVDDAALLAPPAQDWLSYNRTPDENRFSPLDQLTPENVGRLGLAWHLDLGTNRGVESTPLYADGVLYVTLPWSDVLAVDARTGKEIWKFDAKVSRKRGFLACCDVVNRGLAMYKGRVYLATFDGRLVSLDAKTGKVVFDVQTTDKTKPFSITAAPRVMSGKVLIGNGGAEYGVRGYLSAYDAESGKMLWRFYSVPGDPSKGFENKAMEEAAKTWTGKWWQFGGGGTMWEGIAYDPKLNLLYAGTGNGSTWSKYVRSPDGGDNLYLASIVAIDLDTGLLKWYYQNTPGDTWDYDSNQHIILADLMIDGQKRDVLMQANKNGYFYVIDRKTGKLISADTFVTVNWATGMDANGKPMQTKEAQWNDKSALVFPWYLGGHNWQPMSYSPKTGLVYVPIMDAPAIYAPDDAFENRPGATNMGANFSASVDAPPELLKGALMAWNPATRKEVWRKTQWGFWNGGTLSTAGGLVFQGTGDGKMLAYRADNGDQLWESPAGTGVIAGPMTFEMDGVQHVALMAGWGGAGGLVGGRAAKAAGVISYGRLLVFKADAKAVLPPTPVPVAEANPPKTDAKLEYLKAGETLYGKHCVGCHGIGAVGGGSIPDLRTMPNSFHEQWDAIVMGGILADNGMVSMKKWITKAQSEAIHEYIKYRAAEGDVATPINAKAAVVK
jgi:quinohemoprotein ethanol dehydrogenase